MIYSILEQSLDLYRDKYAVCIGDNRLTYGELNDLVIELALKLNNLSVRPGNVVALFMSNSIEFIVAFFAVNYIGATILPVYPKTPIIRIKELLNNFHVKSVITIPFNYEKLKSLQSVQLNETTMFLSYDLINKKCILDFTIKGNRKIEDVEKMTIHTELILLSSGTTSIPKGIMLSEHNIISNVLAISKYLNLTDCDNLLLLKHIHHASSIVGEFLVSIYNGCCLFLDNKLLTDRSIINLVEKNKITVFFCVPSMLKRLFQTGSNIQKLSNLKIIHFYGSKIDKNLLIVMANSLPNVNLIYSYGLTEASPRVTYIERAQLLKRIESSGKPIEGVEVKIVDHSGTINKSGELGQIIVNGPNVMLGYYGNPELTRKTIKKKWLYTGDIGYIDADGFLYVKGRRDNMIIREGKNIHPEEVEAIISRMHGVLDCLVRNERISNYSYKTLVAYVVSDKSNYVDENAIFAYCKQQLDDYKVPQKIFIVKALSKTISGKIIRKQEITIV